jgi:hypothetical protein
LAACSLSVSAEILVTGNNQPLAYKYPRVGRAQMLSPKKVTKQKSHNSVLRGAKAMWGTLFAFVFMISVAMGLAALRLGL